MELRKGDQVKIVLGKDRGKKGKIIQIFPEKNLIVIEGLNLRVKHARPKKEGQKGERVQFSAPMDASNALLVCPRCGKPTRIGHKNIENKKSRMCRKCKEVI
ncbi:MAG: 50S ribosomal protein L24 [Candidatus Kerfeldbacteria bacterium CG_4_10_14_0_8_um_filter_42_10]|uniref:Large ribosomal subunit protein uL24 n=1 Tax=Candidatus Kerfeldbacteria bacterium CG_4_10_14_0_8_um_filter_42_10 TaxID=2014248 RepID=A0A2M7RHX9_9BACT|nr:MAG: 50S ribosomal protein L24 [Candidatus Kerfeldbacteria bacterium CG_4_10_14_0_8_um_filter_42_10]